MGNIFEIKYTHDNQREGCNLQAPNFAKITGAAGTLAIIIEFGWSRVTEAVEGYIVGAPSYAGGKIRGDVEIKANLRIQLDGIVRIVDVRSNNDRGWGPAMLSRFMHPAMVAAMQGPQPEPQDSAEAAIGKE